MLISPIGANCCALVVICCTSRRKSQSRIDRRHNSIGLALATDLELFASKDMSAEPQMFCVLRRVAIGDFGKKG